MSLLTVDDLTVRYGDVAAVNGVSFAIDRGESVGIVGESGSGKTQTVLATLGLLPAHAETSGRITLDGTALLGASDAELDRIRGARIAMVFQDPALALNPYRTLGAQFRHILIAHQIADGAAADARIVEAFARVGLPDPERQFRSYPHELSGGMRQRAMIAAALMTEPDVLIADEPTTALDVTVQAQILELLETIRDDTALLFISHDLGVVASCCERTLVMSAGELVESGPTRSVFAAPTHEATQQLIAAAPRWDTPVERHPAEDKLLLTIDEVAVTYQKRGEVPVAAVRDANATLRRGETLAVVGESGSGKTSLARAVLGMVPLDAGRVVFCGEPLASDLDARSLTTRRDLQLVFQDPAGSLNPQHRVETLIAEPLHVHEPKRSATERREKVEAALEDVGLDVSFLDRLPHQLSGGQAQRVAIARALILEPQVLICDEAVAALDNAIQQQILQVLIDVQQRTALSILFISHDLAVVRAISHRVLVMRHGEQIEVNETDALFANPQAAYTQQLLAAVPTLDRTPTA